MASCGNCSEPSSPGPINVLPDIVGLGILISFSVTATAAFAALLNSYFTDSLPRGSFSAADFGFLQTFHACKSCRIRYGAADRKDHPIKACKHNDPEYDKQRREGASAFVLTLSDQQLVTGPAMIVAALVQHCQLSVYEFQVVNSLAWFSSTTHLATLVMLQQYLQENKVVRNIRVIAMLLNMGLLIYTSLIAYTAYTAGSATSIQCVMEDLSYYRPDPLDYANIIITVFFLFLIYGRAILPLYVYGDDNTLLKRWLRNYCCHAPTGPGLEKDEFELWYENEVIKSAKRPGSNARRKQVWTRASTAKQYKIPRTIAAVWMDFRQSFLSTITSLLISFSFGITQLVFTRINKPGISNNENLVDFGQIVPTFLLALPLLAWIEMYFQTHPERAEKNQGSLKNIAPKLRRLRGAFLARTPPTPPKPQQSSTSAESTLTESSAVELDYIRPGVSIRELDVRDLDVVSVSTHHSSTAESAPGNPDLDKEDLSLYNRRDVQFYLNVFFWTSALFSITVGVELWISPPFSIAWSVLEAAKLLFDVFQFCSFAYKTRRKAIALPLSDKAKKHSDVASTLPNPAESPTPSGLQQNREGATPASISPSKGGLTPGSESQATTISGALTSEPQEIVLNAEDSEVSNHALQLAGESRRRQTFESPGEDGEYTERIVTRSDTEADIGIVLPYGGER